MNRLVLLCFLLLHSLALSQINKTNERPKLVVGLVVDQMRWDYLYKYYDRYGEKGFKRLLAEGFSAENTLIPYVPTYTGIGHSTVYTGSVPAIHGIAGNDFYMRETQKTMYCAQDDGVVGVGLDPDNKQGKMSPKNLLTTTMTDELKLATNFQSKVVGISLKDRGAVLPAGHFADAAYWMVDGNWISSSFYMDKLPQYVQQFNQAKHTERYLNQGWQPMYPLSTYNDFVPDHNPYEASYIDGEKVTFPIDLKQISKKSKAGKDVIKSTPFGNTLTLEFAKEVMKNEKLGKNENNVPDFIAISLSSTDYVGHQFAINSPKIEDTYLRLDKDLGEFLDHLDQTIGKGNYTLFLTADHGAAHNPQFILDQKGQAGLFQRREVMSEVNQKLAEKFNVDDLIYTVFNHQVFLDHQKIEQYNLDEDKIKKEVISFYKKQPAILFAVDMEKAGQSSMPERLRNMTINGYHYKRSGDIQLIYEPQWYDFYKDTKGTTHGAWNPYDSHIPLVFMGWGIQKGSTHEQVYMTDIAPTISALLHIQEPNGNIGKPIVDVLKAANQ